jgi:hypothetical protein
MCSGAILLYKIPRVVIGENVNFLGEEDLLRSRGVEVIVANDKDCIDLMKKFIEEKPEVCLTALSCGGLDEISTYRNGSKISASMWLNEHYALLPVYNIQAA